MNECVGKAHPLGEKKNDLRVLSKLNFCCPNNSWLNFLIYRVADNFGNIHAKTFPEIISKNKQYWHFLYFFNFQIQNKTCGRRWTFLKELWHISMRVLFQNPMLSKSWRKWFRMCITNDVVNVSSNKSPK